MHQNWLWIGCKIWGRTLDLGADAKNRRIATHGWEQDSGLDVIDL
jgi:phosphoribosylformimino-5-aminoimidazole carboxamide ribonucleotide (ProFAR) isomerase